MNDQIEWQASVNATIEGLRHKVRRVSLRQFVQSAVLVVITLLLVAENLVQRESVRSLRETQAEINDHQLEINRIQSERISQVVRELCEEPSE